MMATHHPIRDWIETLPLHALPVLADHLDRIADELTAARDRPRVGITIACDEPHEPHGPIATPSTDRAGARSPKANRAETSNTDSRATDARTADARAITSSAASRSHRIERYRGALLIAFAQSLGLCPAEVLWLVDDAHAEADLALTALMVRVMLVDAEAEAPAPSRLISRTRPFSHSPPRDRLG